MKHFLISVAICVFCLVVSFAANAEESIYIGQISHHYNPNNDVKRESHPLLLFETKDNIMYGYWRNSYNRDTFAFGKKFDYFHGDVLGQKYNMGFKAGVATGYRGPFYFTLYAQTDWIDINWLPGVAAGIGFRIVY